MGYTADNPRDAQQVCSEITSLLLTENQELREQVARSTTDFLSRQLDQAKHNLDVIDTKLSEFKIKHFGQLPGDLEQNFRDLSNMIRSWMPAPRLSIVCSRTSPIRKCS